MTVQDAYCILLCMIAGACVLWLIVGGKTPGPPFVDIGPLLPKPKRKKP